MPSEEFSRFLDARGVTVVNLPTSYWSQWTRDLDAGTTFVPRSLRLLVVGSEPAYQETLVRWRRHSSVPVINAYGLTETTVTVTTETFEAAPPGGADTLPIGRPLAGCTAHILDAELAPVPAGTPGELYLGGECLARGYLGLPAQTAERFIPAPAPLEPGARLYRTGDQVRLREDGHLGVPRPARWSAQAARPPDRACRGRGRARQPPPGGAGPCRHDRDALGVVRLIGYVVPIDARSVPSGTMLRAHLSERLP